MRFTLILNVALCLLLYPALGYCADGVNPEDLPIPDDKTPPAPTSPAPTPPVTPTTPTAPGVQVTPNPQTPAGPTAPAPSANEKLPAPVHPAPGNGDMIMIPRAEWEQIKRDIEELKRSRAQTGQTAPPPNPTGPGAGGTTPVNPEDLPPLGGATGTQSTESSSPSGTSTSRGAEGREAGTTPGSRNYLLLPDISLILQPRGLLSSDRRDPDRGTLRLSEGEVGIQGYLYPHVKMDTFITASPAENEAFQIEEGYITFQGYRKGLDINIGRKFAPFGRTGELHNHSWLYPRQLLPIRNLVTDEALTGDGVNFNYLLPTSGKLFARASFGVFTGEGADVQLNTTNPADPFFGSVPRGTGAGYPDRFYNGRLWLGDSLSDNSELDFGLSHAHGRSVLADDLGRKFAGNVNLYGADVSYRHFMPGGKRLLLRSEYFRNSPGSGLPTHSANGWYALGNLRLSKYHDMGLLYESSGFPQAPGHENASSFIYTTQFSEQFYMRLMATHGNRPGGGYNELRLQFVGGIGPHTHSLE